MSPQSIFSLRESFIVRIWRDHEDTDLWRGQLQHVRSGETIAIADIRNIAVHLDDYLKKTNQQNTGLK